MGTKNDVVAVAVSSVVVASSVVASVASSAIASSAASSASSLVTKSDPASWMALAGFEDGLEGADSQLRDVVSWGLEMEMRHQMNV